MPRTTKITLAQLSAGLERRFEALTREELDRVISQENAELFLTGVPRTQLAIARTQLAIATKIAGEVKASRQTLWEHLTEVTWRDVPCLALAKTDDELDRLYLTFSEQLQRDHLDYCVTCQEYLSSHNFQQRLTAI